MMNGSISGRRVTKRNMEVGTYDYHMIEDKARELGVTMEMIVERLVEDYLDELREEDFD